jgi:hypothetical protein
MSLSLITRYSGRRSIWTTRNHHPDNQQKNHHLNNNQQNNHLNNNQQKSMRSMMINMSGHNPTLQLRRRLLQGIHHKGIRRRNKDIHHKDFHRGIRRKVTLLRHKDMYHSKDTLRHRDTMQGQQ